MRQVWKLPLAIRKDSVSVPNTALGFCTYLIRTLRHTSRPIRMKPSRALVPFDLSEELFILVVDHSMKTITCIRIFTLVEVISQYLLLLLKTSPVTLLPALVAHVLVPEPAGFYHEARAQGLQRYIWTQASHHEIPQISTSSCGGLVMSDSSRIPWTVACQAPLSVGFSRQGYWSGLPFPSPGDLLHWQGDLYHWTTRETHTAC